MKAEKLLPGQLTPELRRRGGASRVRGKKRVKKRNRKNTTTLDETGTSARFGTISPKKTKGSVTKKETGPRRDEENYQYSATREKVKR